VLIVLPKKHVRHLYHSCLMLVTSTTQFIATLNQAATASAYLKRSKCDHHGYVNTSLLLLLLLLAGCNMMCPPLQSYGECWMVSLSPAALLATKNTAGSS
jgi:hypothetical protein